MISEEKLINRLRKRKARLFAVIFVIAAIFVPIIYGSIVLNRLTASILKSGVPEHSLLLSAAKVNVQIYFCSAALGVFIACLINGLAGWPKDRLLISMWDKIKRQEEELGRLSKMVEGSSPPK